MKHAPMASLVRTDVWYLLLICLASGLATSAVLGGIVLLIASAA